MKILLRFLIIINLFFLSDSVVVFAQQISNLNLIRHFDVRPDQPPTVLNSIYSSIWGWTSGTGKEYAILCCVTGTSFIDVSNNLNIYECDFIPAVRAVNRECKTYLNYAYVTSDYYGKGWIGLQIFDLSYLPDSVHLVKNWTYGNFQNAHTIFQENNFLYLCGGNVNPSGGIAIIDISNPESPVKRGDYLQGYVHDCYVRNDTIYAAVTGKNKFIILDAKDKDNITEIVEIDNLPGYSLTHSCWVTDNGNFLITADESRDPPGIIVIWDIQDFNNIKMITTYRPPGDQTSIAHNPFVKGNILYISHHTAGLRLVDIRNPNVPSEFAFHDTYPKSNSSIAAGNWGSYPFFNSGKIISSDMQTGLYVHTIINDPTYIINAGVNVNNFSLSQNYPNPFNPVTKINFEIPEYSKVKLTIFDIKGKELKIILNEFKSAGKYSAEFSGSNFSSGVYFYKIEAGKYIDSKRMVLLK